MGAMWNTDETYYKRIEAMEFAMQYDDSKDYRGLKMLMQFLLDYLEHLKLHYVCILLTRE